MLRPTTRTPIKIRQSKRTRSQPAAQHELNLLCADVTKTTMVHLITLTSQHHLRAAADVKSLWAPASKLTELDRRSNTPRMRRSVPTGPNTKNLWLPSGATSAKNSTSRWRLRSLTFQRPSARSPTILITTRTRLRLTRKSTGSTKS